MTKGDDMYRSLGTALLSLVMVGSALPARAQEAAGTLAKIKAAGEIVFGYRETSIPFSYIEKDQTPKGYSIDLCMRIADEVKQKIGNPALKVRFVPVSPQTRIPLLINGTIDIECGSTTNNLTRQEQVSFLPTTFITGTKIMVKANSPIKSIDDLVGHRAQHIVAALVAVRIVQRLEPIEIDKGHAEGLSGFILEQLAEQRIYPGTIGDPSKWIAQGLLA